MKAEREWEGKLDRGSEGGRKSKREGACRSVKPRARKVASPPLLLHRFSLDPV